VPAAAAAAEPEQAGGCRGGYPGWRMVWGLAVTETVSYGVLYYSFAAFLLPMQHSLGFSQATLTGAFSLSVLLTGAGAVPAGAWLDCCGARGLMTAGSLLGAGCVLVWARAGNVLGLYLAFAGIGLAGAAVLYEPAFATINAWFDARRQQALLTVTMVAGLASTIFLPASAFLISRLGWRQALLILAAVQAATAVPHVLLVRRRPADHGWQLDGTRGPSSLPAAQAPGSAPAKAPPDVIRGGELSATLRSGPVAFLTAGAILGSGAIAAVAVLFLAYLRQGGYTLAVASAAAGALGLVQIAGRAVLTVLARRMPTAIAAAAMLAAQAAGAVVLLLVSGLPGVVAFVALFGLGFGVLSIARPDMLAQYAPRRLYARLSGIQASLVIAAEAAAPTAAAALRAASASYTPVFAAVALCSLGAALLFVAADRARRPGRPRGGGTYWPSPVRTVR
jgi:MFS family permease